MTLPANCLSFLSLFLQAGYISIQLFAITASGWLRAEVDGAVYKFSLSMCQDCPNGEPSYTPECMLNIDCEINPDSPLCPLARHLMRGRDMYLSAAFVSLLAALVLILGQSYKRLGYEGHPPKLVYSLLVVEALGSLMAIVMWFGETNASFRSSTKTAEFGPICAIAALAVCTLACGLTFLCEVNRSGQSSPPLIEIGGYKFLGLTLRQWVLIKVLPLLIISLTFDVFSLSSDWVRYHTSRNYYGNLFTIDVLQSFENISYSCIAGSACASTGQTMFQPRNCNSFPRLASAGQGFVWADAITTLLVLLWVESGVFYVSGVEYGVPLLTYFLPVLSICGKVLSLSLWFTLSQASFFADCEVSSTADTIDFCAANGPVYSLWQLFCMSVASVFFLALYRARRRQMVVVQTLQTQSFAMEEKSGKLTCSPNESFVVEEFDSPNSRPNTGSAPRSNQKTSTEASGLQTMRDVGGSECIACGQERDLDDIRFELPCGHWIHIECFAKIGSNRKNCPKCNLGKKHTEFL